MAEKKKNSIKKRGQARSRRPDSKQFAEFMTTKWDKEVPTPLDFTVEKHFAEVRRSKLSQNFLGDRLVIEAGDLKTRSNDCDYRFRPFTPFSYYTGLGMDFDPGAVMVFEPITIKIKQQKPYRTHVCTLYVEPMKGRDSAEFFTSSSKGEFWIGKRPGIADFEESLGVTVKDKEALKKDLKKLIKPPFKTRLLSESDSDEKLLEFASEHRLIKDNYEISEMKKAISATKAGFERVIQTLPRAISSQRGERVVEGEFNANAIELGNAVGYETIAAAGENATTLHWIRNNGRVQEGDLLLLDAGVEMDSLYTADITRTLPISGKFNQWQRNIYEVVLKAANAAFRKAESWNSANNSTGNSTGNSDDSNDQPVKFRDVHDEAMKVIVEELIKLDILKVSASEALSKDGQQHRRWMCHGTSHHLGMDVHDCAAARASMYHDANLEEGMIFTIEPGLYFKSDDLLVPAQYRGIGIRIEDDILVTSNGAVNLSADIPRNAEHVESWMSNLRSNS
jgi:Xaa-Pro aminopeptidase